MSFLFKAIIIVFMMCRKQESLADVFTLQYNCLGKLKSIARTAR